MTWTLLTIAALAATSPNSTAPDDTRPLAAAIAPVPMAAPDFAALAAAPFVYAPAAASAPASHDGDDPDGASMAMRLPGQDSNGDTIDATTTAPTTSPNAYAGKNPYFVRDSWRWQITGAAATQFDDHFALAGISASYFIDHDFTIDFDLNGMYYEQDEGDSTPGINLGILLRWHFLIDDDKKWSAYLDTGLGVLFTAHNVPEGGKQFNLTPQIGAGFSWLLDAEKDTRLLAGIRWHHTSNANTHENNPGANKIMLYAGLNFPF